MFTATPPLGKGLMLKTTRSEEKHPWMLLVVLLCRLFDEKVALPSELTGAPSTRTRFIAEASRASPYYRGDAPEIVQPLLIPVVLKKSQYVFR